MAVSNPRQMEHHITIRGGYMVPVYRVVIHPNEDGAAGYWAKCISLPGCFTDGDTINEIQTNMHEAVNLTLKVEFPSISDYLLEFTVADE